MAWFSFRPYVSVAARRRQAEATARKLSGKGRTLEPVRLTGRTIATTFWGQAWCANLESYSDYANRLPRGRSYLRNGSVIDLQIGPGTVAALVQGSSLYKVSIRIAALAPARWRKFTRACAGKVSNLLDLLQGRLSRDILADITAQGTGLFPAPKEIDLDCSCPDWADMCKHVAAVLYGVGARLDAHPELFFTLRGVDMQDLLAAASVSATESAAPATATDALAGADLAEIFGVELESATAPAPASGPASKAPVTRRTSRASKARKGRARVRVAPKPVAVPSAPPPAPPPAGPLPKPARKPRRPRRATPGP